MGTIVERPRKKGGKAYMAKIVIKREGKVVHRETKTFDRRPAAEAWIARREEELSKPGAIDRAKQATNDPTLSAVIDQYIAESEREIGKSKAQVLRTIKNHGIAGKRCSQIDSKEILAFLQELDAKPATRAGYLSFLGAVVTVAKPMWGYPLESQEVQNAWIVGFKMGIVGKSSKRERRPTIEELDRIMSHFQDRSARRASSIPMHYIVAFAIFSTRRLDEIARIAWKDYDREGKRVMVRDMKNPGEKQGNDVWVDLVPEAVAIIDAMPKISDQIFPFNPGAMGAAFTRCCQLLGISGEDIPDEQCLHFHDLRHEGVSRLFEMGWNIPHVAAVSGHRNWTSLKRYTQLRQRGDKFANWKWLPIVTTPLKHEAPAYPRPARRLRRDRPGEPGRITRGEASPVAKLTENDVREIRAADGTISSIAQRYQIARAHVRAIKERRIWRHVK